MPVHNVSWDAIDWVQVRPGMERKTFAGEGATLALFRIQPRRAGCVRLAANPQCHATARPPMPFACIQRGVAR